MAKAILDFFIETKDAKHYSKSSGSLPKGVYSKDDCGKLKSKDLYHTKRSKQNTYHVVNKNIAPSKVTNEQRQKRGCLPGASPSLGFWLFLNILGCLGHPNLRLLPPFIP